MTRLPAPDTLSESTRLWWDDITAEFRLEPHHRRLLELACRAWDRAEEASARVAADGAYLEDRFGQLRAHPAIDVERRCRDQFRAMLRELGLDVAAPGEARGKAAPANRGRLRAS